MSDGWIAAFKEHPVTDIATRYLGMTVRARALTPCPKCNADKRGGADPRPPIGLDRGSAGWKCWACQAQGDVLELVAWKVLGRGCTGLDTEGWAELRRWALEHRLVSEEPGHDRRRGGSPAGSVQSVAALMGKPIRKLGRTAPPPSDTDGDGPAPARGEASRGRSLGGGGGGGKAPQFQWAPDLAQKCCAAIEDHKDDPMVAAAMAYLLQHRKLSPAALDEAGIGVLVYEGKVWVNEAGRPYVTIPLPNETREVVNMKFRSVPIVGTCEYCQSPLGCKKCREYRACYNRPLPLYGSHALSPDKGSPILLVEGEFDRLAMMSYGWSVNVVSGTAGAGTWEEGWTDLLEPYDRIVGLYDPDPDGDKGWKKASEVLGTYRCERAKLPRKDAGDCLAEGIDADDIGLALAHTTPAHDIEVVKPDALLDDLEVLIEHPDRLRGVPTGSRKLNAAVGGFRPGVITVTGESGQGKTTFTTWLMYQQARQGNAVLVTSFEQQPIGTLQKLMRIQVQKDFTQVSKDRRRAAAGELAAMPLHILKHYGNIDPKKLIEVFRYCKRRLGIRQFLVDHLGFLIDPDARDERLAIQAVMRAMALVAKEMDIIIYLVVHPSNQGKEIPGKFSRVTMKDLKGASAIRQESDDILVVTRENPNWEKGRKVKRPWPQARVWVEKVRSEFGSAGVDIPLAFDPGSCTYADEWGETPAGRDGLLVPREGAHPDADETGSARAPGAARARRAAAPPDGSPRRRLRRDAPAAEGGGQDPDDDPGG
mgnify:CR=1 FL=1